MLVTHHWPQASILLDAFADLLEGQSKLRSTAQLPTYSLGEAFARPARARHLLTHCSYCSHSGIIVLFPFPSHIPSLQESSVTFFRIASHIYCFTVQFPACYSVIVDQVCCSTWSGAVLSMPLFGSSDVAIDSNHEPLKTHRKVHGALIVQRTFHVRLRFCPPTSTLSDPSSQLPTLSTNDYYYQHKPCPSDLELCG